MGIRTSDLCMKLPAVDETAHEKTVYTPLIEPTRAIRPVPTIVPGGKMDRVSRVLGV